MILSIEQIQDATKKSAPKYTIKKALLFGSYADGVATEQSDIDIIVEFNKPAISLFVINRLKYELEDLLQKQVDIIHGPINSNDMIIPQKMVPLYG